MRRMRAGRCATRHVHGRGEVKIRNQNQDFASSPVLPTEHRMNAPSFPQRFVWGAATAAYQIEGGAAEGGKGPSVWDMLCEKEGAIHGGHDGRVASDHYHRWLEDIALFRQLGLTGYR